MEHEMKGAPNLKEEREELGGVGCPGGRAELAKERLIVLLEACVEADLPARVGPARR